MKKDDIFKAKMPSVLKSSILDSARPFLIANSRSNRRNLLVWIFGISTAFATIGFLHVRFNSNNHQQFEIAQLIDILEDIQNDDDFDLLAELEVLEELEYFELIDDKS